MLRRLSLVAQILVLLVVLVIAATVWIAIHAVDAGARLEAVHSDISRIRADLLAERDPTADLRQAQLDARAAQHDTHDPVWFLASWLPPIHTVRGLSSAVDGLANNALPSVVTVGSTLEPGRLRIAHNQIALAPLQAAVPSLTSADAALVKARDQVANLSPGWVGVLSSARSKALSQLSSLAGSIGDTARFARAGPDMLGAHGKRRYFVGIQNNAEARATGGLVAAYAIVTTDHGKIRVVKHGTDSDLLDAARSTVALDPNFSAIYGTYLPAKRWSTSNMSPDFPVAADIWAHLWQAESGQHIDGAFGIDPFGLAAILGATGTVTVPGDSTVYSSANLASFIESGEYAQFPGINNLERKDFLSTVSNAVIHKMLSGSGDASTITTALGRAAGNGHFTLWSARPVEEAQISGTPLAGELPVTRNPFASVSVDNAGGTKLDYYLDRTLDYRAGSCSGAVRNSTISVRLLNDAPRHGLPIYVRYGGLTPAGKELIETVPRNRTLIVVHATTGAALLGATLDGQPVQVGAGLEAGHPVFTVTTTLNPGVARVLQFRLQEPTVSGKALTQVQPLARAQDTEFDVPSCS